MHYSPPLTRAGFEITAQASSAILERIYQMILDISCALLKNKVEFTIDSILEIFVIYIGFNLGSIFNGDSEIITSVIEALKNQKSLARKFAEILEHNDSDNQRKLKLLMQEEGIAIPQSLELMSLISDKVADSQEYFLTTNQIAVSMHAETDNIMHLITPEMEYCLNDTWQYLNQMFEKNMTPAYELLLGILSRVILLACLVLAARFSSLNEFMDNAERYFDELLSGVSTSTANIVH